MGEYETKAREYIETCPNVNDRAMILALAVALDSAHTRITVLCESAAKLDRDVQQIIKDAGR